jgi:hypothetical protein
MEKLNLSMNLNINKHDLRYHQNIIIEKLFCLALLTQGTDVTEKVLTEFIKYRDIMFPGKYDQGHPIINVINTLNNQEE